MESIETSVSVKEREFIAPQETVIVPSDAIREETERSGMIPGKKEAAEEMSKESRELIDHAVVGIAAFKSGLLEMVPGYVSECCSRLSKDISPKVLEQVSDFAKMLLDDKETRELGKELIGKVEAAEKEQMEMN